MVPAPALLIGIFVLGFMAGYVVRAIISRRRHKQARLRHNQDHFA
jgi:hypothetical protein